jgi:hypothetical protein
MSGPKIKVAGLHILVSGPGVRVSGPNIEVAGLHNLAAGPASRVAGPNCKIFCPNVELQVQLVR